MTTVVIMPGGFHPFHAGHLALYQSAQRAFPDAEVFVAATNDTSARPFPFAVKEKLAKLAGVDAGHFVQVKSPIRAEEITSKFNPNRDTLIFVRSEKDATKQPQAGGVKKDGSPSYLQPLEGAKKLEPFSKHAYMAYLPTVEFGPGMTSATEIRTAWPALNDQRKTALVMSLYPKTQTNLKLAATVVKMLDTAMGSELEEGAEEALQYATQAHAGQTRSGGDPYITHPMRVADHIRQYKQSHNLDALISAAYLHDTIEDTDTTQEALHDLFGGLVASLVKELTSDPEQIKKMGKAAYLSHKMAAMSSYALVIKLADRLDNVKDITTARTPEWRAKYAAETNQILDYIEKTRALSGTHNKLISLIRAKLAEIDNPPQLDEFAPDEGGGARKFIPWPEFIEQVKQIVGKDFDCVENVVKSTIKARFVPHDPMEYGPTMLYSYYETRAGGRNKGAVSTRGAIQVGKYFGNNEYFKTNNPEANNKLLTAFSLLKGTPFERHFDLTFDNIYKIANIIQGNTQGAYQMQPANETINPMTANTSGAGAGMMASYQARENQPIDEDYIDEKWSQKYKSSIDCSNPKGFSQRAHCQGRKK